MRRWWTAVLAVVSLLAAGCSVATTAGVNSPEATTAPAAVTAPTGPVPSDVTDAPATGDAGSVSAGRASAGRASAGSASEAVSAAACRLRGSGLYVLPDPVCTPGATNPAVTQSTIGRTICTPGWSSTVRPPESVTEPLKRSGMAAYGEGGPISSYEEDHLISLELGGAPASPANLWPEPGSTPNPKDAVEDAAHRAVCDGRMSLTAAQTAIARDWIALGQALGVTATGDPDPAAGSSQP